MQTDVPMALFAEPLTETETLEIEIIDKRSIRRAPVGAQPKPLGATVTMALSDWVDADKTMWELHSMVELALMQRDEALEALQASRVERELLVARLREWKTYARGVERRLHEAQLRNVGLVQGLRRVADVARQAITAPPFAFGLRDQLRERFNEIAEEVG